MKKLIVALALMAFLAPMTPAIARDANRDALRDSWKAPAQQGQNQQKKVRSADKPEVGKFQPPFQPSDNVMGPEDYDSPKLWEPAGN